MEKKGKINNAKKINSIMDYFIYQRINIIKSNENL